jgi:hypothetical protein
MRAVVTWVILGVFGLLFAFDVWEAIGNFIGIYSQGLLLGLVLTGWGWFFLLLGVLAPIALFVVAAILTRKMSVGKTLALFAVALMVSAVIALDITLAAPYGLILG